MKKSTEPSEKVKINPKIEQIQLNRRGGASSDQLASAVDLGSSNNSESDGERSCNKRKVDETESFECREICALPLGENSVKQFWKAGDYEGDCEVRDWDNSSGFIQSFYIQMQQVISGFWEHLQNFLTIHWTRSAMEQLMLT
ncbi:hypothetical protein Leryth_006448 [Lithospermum erythrorhizon]|nr:hypothetical protein Leryth_006448 [Lithospermum erythrorhizon]